MGYYSRVIIGVGKEVLAHDLISPIIAESLRNEPHTDSPFGRYWDLCWKFYSSYPEVVQILEMFDALLENDLPFGAYRLGEDFGDLEQWGNPYEFRIQTQQELVLDL